MQVGQLSCLLFYIKLDFIFGNYSTDNIDFLLSIEYNIIEDGKNVYNR